MQIFRITRNRKRRENKISVGVNRIIISKIFTYYKQLHASLCNQSYDWGHIFPLTYMHVCNINIASCDGGPWCTGPLTGLKGVCEGEVTAVAMLCSTTVMCQLCWWMRWYVLLKLISCSTLKNATSDELDFFFFFFYYFYCIYLLSEVVWHWSGTWSHVVSLWWVISVTTLLSIMKWCTFSSWS